MPVYLEQFRNEEKRDETCTEQVYEEDVIDRCFAKKNEINEVKCNVEEDKKHLQRHETYGSMLETQEAERQGLQGVQSNHRSHHQQVFGMLCVSEIVCYGSDKAEDKQKEDDCEAPHHSKAGGEDGIGLLSFIVGESEKCCFHTERQDCEY